MAVINHHQYLYFTTAVFPAFQSHASTTDEDRRALDALRARLLDAQRDGDLFVTVDDSFHQRLLSAGNGKWAPNLWASRHDNLPSQIPSAGAANLSPQVSSPPTLAAMMISKPVDAINAMRNRVKDKLQPGEDMAFFKDEFEKAAGVPFSKLIQPYPDDWREKFRDEMEGELWGILTEQGAKKVESTCAIGCFDTATQYLAETFEIAVMEGLTRKWSRLKGQFTLNTDLKSVLYKDDLQIMKAYSDIADTLGITVDSGKDAPSTPYEMALNLLSDSLHVLPRAFTPRSLVVSALQWGRHKDFRKYSGGGIINRPQLDAIMSKVQSVATNWQQAFQVAGIVQTPDDLLMLYRQEVDLEEQKPGSFNRDDLWVNPRGWLYWKLSVDLAQLRSRLEQQVEQRFVSVINTVERKIASRPLPKPVAAPVSSPKTSPAPASLPFATVMPGYSYGGIGSPGPDDDELEFNLTGMEPAAEVKPTPWQDRLKRELRSDLGEALSQSMKTRFESLGLGVGALAKIYVKEHAVYGELIKLLEAKKKFMKGLINTHTEFDNHLMMDRAAVENFYKEALDHFEFVPIPGVDLSGVKTVEGMLDIFGDMLPNLGSTEKLFQVIIHTLNEVIKVVNKELKRSHAKPWPVPMSRLLSVVDELKFHHGEIKLVLDDVFQYGTVEEAHAAFSQKLANMPIPSGGFTLASPRKGWITTQILKALENLLAHTNLASLDQIKKAAKAAASVIIPPPPAALKQPSPYSSGQPVPVSSVAQPKGGASQTAPGGVIIRRSGTHNAPGQGGGSAPNKPAPPKGPKNAGGLAVGDFFGVSPKDTSPLRHPFIPRKTQPLGAENYNCFSRDETRDVKRAPENFMGNLIFISTASVEASPSPSRNIFSRLRQLHRRPFHPHHPLTTYERRMLRRMDPRSPWLKEEFLNQSIGFRSILTRSPLSVRAMMR